jgi:hypothetical protein
MLATCTAVVTGAACLVALAPVAQLLYVAWRYRRQSGSSDPWECTAIVTQSRSVHISLRGNRKALPHRCVRGGRYVPGPIQQLWRAHHGAPCRKTQVSPVCFHRLGPTRRPDRDSRLRCPDSRLPAGKS